MYSSSTVYYVERLVHINEVSRINSIEIESKDLFIS